MYSVYTCEDFTKEGGILTLFRAKEVAKVETFTQWKEVYEELMAREIVPNAIICPNIVNQEFNIIFFK